MHGQHPVWAKGTGIVFGCVIQHLLGDHACACATPSPWLAELAFRVDVGAFPQTLLKSKLVSIARVMCDPCYVNLMRVFVRPGLHGRRAI